MPKVTDTPKALRPYLFLGVGLDYEEGKDDALGDCPFCTDGDGKFGVKLATGVFQCWKCKAKGNGGSFVTQFYSLCKVSSDKLPDARYLELASSRSLLSQETLRRWGVVQSPLTGEWLVPGCTTEGKVAILYRYTYLGANGTARRILLTPPDAKHHLFGTQSHLWGKQADTVYVCEGPWDAMVLWEILARAKQDSNGKLTITGNPDLALLSESNVLAVPGCNVFFEQWCKLFNQKVVVFCYDSDHPKKDKAGRVIPSAGYAGLRHAINVLSRSDAKPTEVRYLHWGPEGYDPQLKSGTDLRDVLGQSPLATQRVTHLASILGRIEPIPTNLVVGRKAGSVSGKAELDVEECESWRELVNSWRKAIKWTAELEKALSCMLASVVSTEIPTTSQLWMKIIGPPSCGKSTLCEAIAVATQYVKSVSTLRGFHSGYKTDKSGEEDVSLLKDLRNMTLITKDGDTLLTSPNLDQILSEARDIYDKVSRAHYRHGLNRSYSNLNMTWLLCGTSSLRKLDSSELGQRFLDCVIFDDIPEELEDSVNLKTLNQLESVLSFTSEAESEDTPEMIAAKQLTGGYVVHLRQNFKELYSQVRITEETKLALRDMGTFVAFLRARPSTKQDEDVCREFSIRLVQQLGRLAYSLAVVLNKTSVDQEVLSRVRSVAVDTARGRTLSIAKYLYDKAVQGGASEHAILTVTNETDDSLRKILRFLRRIKAVERYNVNEAETRKAARYKYRLSGRLHQLYESVMP